MNEFKSLRNLIFKLLGKGFSRLFPYLATITNLGDGVKFRYASSNPFVKKLR
jgi:hypothetical protein